MSLDTLAIGSFKYMLEFDRLLSHISLPCLSHSLSLLSSLLLTPPSPRPSPSLPPTSLSLSLSLPPKPIYSYTYFARVSFGIHIITVTRERPYLNKIFAAHAAANWIKSRSWLFKSPDEMSRVVVVMWSTIYLVAYVGKLPVPSAYYATWFS